MSVRKQGARKGGKLYKDRLLACAKAISSKLQNIGSSQMSNAVYILPKHLGCVGQYHMTLGTLR